VGERATASEAVSTTLDLEQLARLLAVKLPAPTNLALWPNAGLCFLASPLSEQLAAVERRPHRSMEAAMEALGHAVAHQVPDK